MASQPPAWISRVCTVGHGIGRCRSPRGAAMRRTVASWPVHPERGSCPSSAGRPARRGAASAADSPARPAAPERRYAPAQVRSASEAGRSACRSRLCPRPRRLPRAHSEACLHPLRELAKASGDLRSTTGYRRRPRQLAAAAGQGTTVRPHRLQLHDRLPPLDGAQHDGNRCEHCARHAPARPAPRPLRPAPAPSRPLAAPPRYHRRRDATALPPPPYRAPPRSRRHSQHLVTATRPDTPPARRQHCAATRRGAGAPLARRRGARHRSGDTRSHRVPGRIEGLSPDPLAPLPRRRSDG